MSATLKNISQDMQPPSSSSTTTMDDTFSDVSSCSSTSTFDFTKLLDPNESQLLSRSLSLEALPPITDEDLPPFDDVPPFPPPRRLRLGASTSPGDYPLKTLRRATTILDTPSVTLSMPTTPRSANVSKEPRIVDTSPICYMDERQAWEDTQAKRYHEALGAAAPVIPSPKTRRASERSSLYRNAFVSEDPGNDQARRWSIHVPVTTMNQETLDMVLQLQNLNSFFKEGLEESDLNAATKEEERPEPPSLMVSNSHSAIPISLESSGEIAHHCPLPLATRRGKNQPTPLLKTAKYSNFMTEYPSIPTAFLGSPTTYSPKFEYANAADELCLDLEDMISSLRYQCASMQSESRRTPQPEDLSADSDTRPFEGADNEDEWAFVNSLLRNPDTNVTDTSSIKKAHTSERPQDAPGPRKPSPALSRGTLTSNVNIAPTSLGVTRSPPRGPPPSTPPPPIPSSSPPSPPKVRGILKNSKNVRFASLPDKGSNAVENVETPSRPRLTMPLVPVDRPSRLRPKSNTITGCTPPLAPPRAHDTTSSHPTRDAKRSAPGGGRPVSVPVSNRPEDSRARGSISPGQPRTPLSAVSRQSTIPAQKPKPASLGRHSLGRAIKAADINKELESPKSRASHTPSLTKRWTNENNFRRDSDASQVTPKSRMPVPLRNVLARFK